jgi:curved DNA-binding protein CbpA
MDAYALLEVEHSATAVDIRRAYRAMAKTHHPDRTVTGSAEHSRATARMGMINAAYELIREAPIRHHPISWRSDVDYVFTQSQVDEAVRIARLHRRVREVATAAAIATMCVIVGLAFLPGIR